MSKQVQFSFLRYVSIYNTEQPKQPMENADRRLRKNINIFTEPLKADADNEIKMMIMISISQNNTEKQVEKQNHNKQNVNKEGIIVKKSPQKEKSPEAV